jgi:Beta-lactamase class C and other penicillin binding proteins
VKKGEIPEERINASVRRILQAKKWTGVLTKAPEPISAVEKLAKEKKTDEVSKDLSIRSITLVKTDDSVFPLDKNKKYLHLVFTDGNKYPYSTDFNQELKKRNGKIETILMPVNPGSVQRNLIDGKLKNCDGIIISVYMLFKQSSGKISLSQTAINFINGLKKAKIKKVIMLAHSNPYVLSDSPWVDVFLTNYGAVLSSEVALAEALFGENNITGTLPVSIPGTDFKRGMGINLFEWKKKTLNYKDKTDQIDKLILHGIQDSVFPGAAISIIKDDTVFYQKAYGNYTYNSGSPEIELTSLFDLASLTKVTATLFATMKLYEEGRLDLNAPVEKYLPEFVNKNLSQLKAFSCTSRGCPHLSFTTKWGCVGKR